MHESTLPDVVVVPPAVAAVAGAVVAACAVVAVVADEDEDPHPVRATATATDAAPASAATAGRAFIGGSSVRGLDALRQVTVADPAVSVARWPARRLPHGGE